MAFGKVNYLVCILLAFLARSLICQENILNSNESNIIAMNQKEIAKHSQLNHVEFVNGTSKEQNISRSRRFWLSRRINSGSLSELSARLRREKGLDQEMHSQPFSIPVDETGELQITNQKKYARILDSLREVHRSNVEWKHLISSYNCDFENDCKWTWRKDIAHGFFITSGGNLQDGESGPKHDANKREFGSYLLLRLSVKFPKSPSTITSPLIPPTTSNCKLNFFIYQDNMIGTEIRVVGDKLSSAKGYQTLGNHTQWLINIIPGKDTEEWQKYSLSIGKIANNFTILLEVVPAENMSSNATVAFDNIQLYECFAQNEDKCSAQQYRCKNTKECVDITRVCDFQDDCHLGDDERQNCHVMPYGSRCTFEESDWCGWTSSNKNELRWTRHNGLTPRNFSGPSFDHTYMNTSGHYMIAMLQDQFASQAVLYSTIFNPPPRAHGNSSSKYYNSCAIRFYLYKSGRHKNGLLLQVTEITPNENKTTKIYWNYMEDHGEQWNRKVFLLPNITNRYFFHFEAKKGFRYLNGIALDDISLTPECFGINIPENDLQGYNYWNPKLELMQETVVEFKNTTVFKLTTCGAEGRYGPRQMDCDQAYEKTNVVVNVLTDFNGKGMQKWLVPTSNFYTIIVAGAAGGKGSAGMGSSRGAVATMVVYLDLGSALYMAIGQKGTSACLKIYSQANNCSNTESKRKTPTTVRDLLSYQINDSGGGGGGGTYVFYRNESGHRIPLIIAGGGGGLGLSRLVDDASHHGQEINYNIPPFAGNMTDIRSAGAGGGWAMFPGVSNPIYKSTMGGPLLYGGIGGKACYNSSNNRGDGGFGGGGGGCKNGGGGGGYAGGNANSSNGGGGTSFVNPFRAVTKYTASFVGQNTGDGYVIIIPAITGCNCQYKCVALNERKSRTACVCPEAWKLSDDGYSCIPLQIVGGSPYPPWIVMGLLCTVFFGTVAFSTICFFLSLVDNRYQHRVNGIFRARKTGRSPELQLGRLQGTGNIHEYNPNYEFGGVMITVSDLVHIPRDDIRLIKPLGQGAFGEVYQGTYSKQEDEDLLDINVAVKTLQDLVTKQAQDDFITEALIMSKFDHPNIVKLMGVCFDKHPKFIVLELLQGGDLKNFLRESRPKPNQPSPINMKDLITIAIDIARGCRYLEEKRFIHRDIATRNCLLTSKDVGRVTKIADFGMSRDIYRADYYRKDGKAFLPVKWMPPEAFLEGIFSSKTDVWSFGIVMWEIMKMGFMPYTGCSNKEVMDLVIRGGRLDKPDSCPGPVYAIMASCWHPKPDLRPNFAVLMEQLGCCLQDPDVINAPLPMFYSTDKDTAPALGPSELDENRLQILPNASNYLIPNHVTPAITEGVSVISTDTPVDKLISNSHCWGQAFNIPNSQSTQPLLDNTNQDEENNLPKIEKTPNGISNNNFIMKNDSSIKLGVSLDVVALIPKTKDKDQNPKSIKPFVNLEDNSVTQNGNYSV